MLEAHVLHAQEPKFDSLQHILHIPLCTQCYMYMYYIIMYVYFDLYMCIREKTLRASGRSIEQFRKLEH